MPDLNIRSHEAPIASQPLEFAYKSRTPRKRTYLRGKLAYGDAMFAPPGALTLDCAIHNISEAGAKIIIARRQAIPAKVYLIAVRSGLAYFSNVVWSHYPARGLKFLETHNLQARLPDELEFLRSLWGGLGGRTCVTHRSMHESRRSAAP